MSFRMTWDCRDLIFVFVWNLFMWPENVFILGRITIFYSPCWNSTLNHQSMKVKLMENWRKTEISWRKMSSDHAWKSNFITGKKSWEQNFVSKVLLNKITSNWITLKNCSSENEFDLFLLFFSLVKSWMLHRNSNTFQAWMMSVVQTWDYIVCKTFQKQMFI